MRTLRAVFVTGATGFVGANLVRALLADGVKVRALARAGSDRSSLSGLDVDWREGDLFGGGALEKTMGGCDACFHVAAAISSSRPEELHQTNVDGTRSVLEAAVRAGCSSIVHTSTMGTLSRADGGPARETDSRLAPGASNYVQSKWKAEEIARDVAARGAAVVIVHPSAPVGAWDRVPTVTGRRIVEVLGGRMPKWIAGAINHVPVEDVARGMILAAARGEPGKSYLLASSGGNLTRDEFVSLVSRIGGIAAPRDRRRFSLRSWLFRTRSTGSTPPAGPASLACDPGWTVQQLGLPQSPLDAAFREAVEWFRGRGR